MLRQLLSIPAVAASHFPKWYRSLAVAVAAGVGIVSYYPNIQHWAAINLMIDLPQNATWVLLWLVIGWFILSLLWDEAGRRQVAARIVFDNPHTWWTGLGPDAAEIVPDRFVQLVSIRVKNSPLNMADGRDVTEAHARAIFRRSGMSPKLVENLRWTQADKPRTDETLPGMKPKFRDVMQYMDIPANGSWRQIDLIVNDPGERCFYGFPGRAQTQGWMAKDCEFENGEYSVDIEVTGKGLDPAAKTTLYLQRLDDGSLFIQSALIRDGINLGATIEMEDSHSAR